MDLSLNVTCVCGTEVIIPIFRRINTPTIDPKLMGVMRCACKRVLKVYSSVEVEE